MSDDSTRAAALALTDGIGWKLLNRLLDHFGSLETILSASAADLQQVKGIGKQISGRICQIDLEKVAADLAQFRAQGITFTTWQDAHYPLPLKTLEDRPLVLFWKGQITSADGRAVAIVGTREPSALSARLAERWAMAFAQRGWTVISGLARGIDTRAHWGALRAGGRSLAVLGSGVNRPYPPENTFLVRKLIANGAVMCEVHPNASTSPDTLVFRNRLIVALSRVALVIEAGATSGALYAGRRARDFGVPVFALANSDGNRAMLSDFAKHLPDNPEKVDEVIGQLAG